MAKVKKAVADTSTEEKIKEAARKVFTQKGYAAARTRDIAEASGINLALLNYYFRSKEKLFHIIMMETVQHFTRGLKDIVNDTESTVIQKLEKIVESYINLLIKEPNIPFFILSEIQVHPQNLLKETGMKEFIAKSVFAKQLQGHFLKKKKAINPVHFLMNFAGLTVFPFIGKPMIKTISGTSEKEFNKLMEERKALVPIWIKSMLELNY